MKKKSKSIGVDLRKKKTYQAQQRLLSDWVVNWKSDQDNVIAQLERAARNNDRGEVFHMIDQLKGLTDKRFTALNNVLYIVSDPDRHLEDERFQSLGVPDEFTDSGSSSEISEINYTLDRKPSVDISNVSEIDVGEIVKIYKSGMSIKEIADWNGVSKNKIIKILVTEGVYTSDIYDRIKAMRDVGKSDWEIKDTLDITDNTLNMYTPYRKGVYNLDGASKNAKAIRRFREKSK